jgi:DNA-binding NarL/FixJ family response regulator
MNSNARVFIVDDHALLRDMLRGRLENEPDLEVIGVAKNAGEALGEIGRLQPDVVLMDIDMPGLGCFDAAKTIKTSLSPGTRIIFLSAFSHDRYIDDALAVGASGYVTKDEPPDVVIRAVRLAAAGGAYFSPKVETRLVVDGKGLRLAEVPQSMKSRTSLLTRREIEVLRYIARGMTKKEIANTMHLSVKTVDHHCTSLMAKLDIHDRVALARFAIREGLADV